MTQKIKRPFLYALLHRLLAVLFLSIPLTGLNSAWALKVGVTAGPHALILEQVAKELAKSGVPLTIVEFNDFILPIAALDSGDLDANSYLHQPFLDEQIKARGYKMVGIAKTIILPLGIYSKTRKTIENLPDGAKISIPNDPANGGRALLLPKKAGLIDLNNLIDPSVLDVSKNPKHLKIIEVEGAQQPRTLQDVDLAVMITDWVLISGLDPNKAIFREGTDSPYANLISVRKGDEQRPDILALKAAYQSKPIRDFILKEFHGAILPAW